YHVGSEHCVGDTTEVGSYPEGASPYGALDMAGSVWEWVRDWYQLDYYNLSPSANPEGPASGEVKVIRGSSWNFGWDGIRVAFRGGHAPSVGDDETGFRCASSSVE
ncbi:MAG: formylglycine-generating enzyme family protein, partial [bacterium]